MTEHIFGIIGDRIHDDTAGIQSTLRQKAVDNLENGEELNMNILVTSLVAEAEKSHSDALVIRRHDA